MKILLCGLIAVLLAPPLVFGQAGSAKEDPGGAVFQVVTYDHEPDTDGNFHGRGSGTGFFISNDGVALTVSRVVYRVVQDPSKYRLLAVIGKEVLAACAKSNPRSTTTFLALFAWSHSKLGPCSEGTTPRVF
jgi:hypothetical protein